MLKLLDLFCGAGGAGMGYSRAGFTVTGVDIAPQPRYPFEFIRADALQYLAEHGAEYDVIHASPPCQGYSTMTIVHGLDVVNSHPRLISAVRELLKQAGKPYIIENVAGAKPEMINPLMLCGSMFCLAVRRHRYFEMSYSLFPPATCKHDYYAVGVYGSSGATANRGRPKLHGQTNSVAEWRIAMGIDWMTGRELAEAIPPDYTQYIGEAIRGSI